MKDNLANLEETTSRLIAGFKAQPQSEIQATLLERERLALAASMARFHAPARHWEREPNQNGSWGQKRAIVEGLLGRGFTAGLFGTMGGGKTQMAVECMKECHRRKRSALFVSAMEFFSTIRASYRSQSTKSEREVVEDFRKPSLLVIDEIGKRGQTEWEDGMLFELLNKRYEDMTDTILTCNLSRADFQKSVGDAIVSRMIECGGLIDCSWSSYRTLTKPNSVP